MRFDFIEPFVRSTIGVLDKVVRCDVTQGTISLVNDTAIAGDISIIIHLENYPRSGIIVSLDNATALNICRTLNSEPCDTLSPFSRDTLAELANMIAGNAVSALNDLGFAFKVSPPLIASAACIAQKVSGSEIMQVPLYTACGEIIVNAILGGNGNEDTHYKACPHCG